MHVQRLAPSYSQLMATLVQGGCARRSGGEGSPHIALLTPGPFSETYFEHAFLARYLGVTLVEGKDLTVRDDMLFLKTLRRSGTRSRPDAASGRRVLRSGRTARRFDHRRAGPAAGDARGQRDGVERAGFGLCRIARVAWLSAGHLAQRCWTRPLSLPSVPTWWCGEKAARDAAVGQSGSGVRHSHLAGRGTRWRAPAWRGRRLAVIGRLAQAHRRDARRLHDPASRSPVRTRRVIRRARLSAGRRCCASTQSPMSTAAGP